MGDWSKEHLWGGILIIISFFYVSPTYTNGRELPFNQLTDYFYDSFRDIMLV